MPRVSVVMPSFESASHIRSAIESILRQTERDIELIIVQDLGARDGTEAILSDLDDERVRVMRNDMPLGLARSLNKGFTIATGEFVARMDSTYIALPDRLEKQARYLDDHLSVGAVGSAVLQAYHDERAIRPSFYPTAPALVLWGMHFGQAMYPASVMFRRTAFEQAGRYSTKTDSVEYELLCRIMRYHDLANMPDPLLKCLDVPIEVSANGGGMVDSVRRAIEVTVGRPVDRDFVRALISPEAIDDRRNAIGAAWLLNTMIRSYRMWYRDRTREEGILVKEDAAARMSNILARSVATAPIGVPMVMWHTTRAGPGVTYRTALSLMERGIGHLGRSEPKAIRKKVGDVEPSRY